MSKCHIEVRGNKQPSLLSEEPAWGEVSLQRHPHELGTVSEPFSHLLNAAGMWAVSPCPGLPYRRWQRWELLWGDALSGRTQQGQLCQPALSRISICSTP